MTVTISGAGLIIAQIRAVSLGEQVRLSTDPAVPARVTFNTLSFRAYLE